MTKQAIIDKAVEIARRDGLINLTRQGLCDELGIKDGSFVAVMDCTFSELIAQIRPLVGPQAGGTVRAKRADAGLRKEHILGIALTMAEAAGYTRINRAELAEAAGISESLIQYHFGSMENLRRAIMRHAVHTKRLAVIAQGLAVKDPHALKAPEAVQLEAIAGMVG